MSHFLFLLCLVFLAVSFKSNNPLMSSLSLIIAMVLASPVLGLVSCVWYTYLLLMLFLSGVFVVVVYFASVSSYMFKVIAGACLLSLLVVFYPYLVVSVCNMSDLAVIYTLNLLSFVVVLIVSLTGLMLISSYMLSSSSAVRTM